MGATFLFTAHLALDNLTSPNPVTVDIKDCSIIGKMEDTQVILLEMKCCFDVPYNVSFQRVVFIQNLLFLWPSVAVFSLVSEVHVAAQVLPAVVPHRSHG